MTNFNDAAHPRNQAGVPGGGQFTSTAHAEPEVTVGAASGPATPYDQYRLAQDSAVTLMEQLQTVDRHRDGMELDFERAALKGIGLGIQDKYPDARYLRLEEDDNRYWVTGLTNAEGKIVVGANNNELDGLELFGEDELSNEVHALSCTDTQWMDGVTPDDGLAAGLGRSDGSVLIDLDKAAALELAPQRSRIEAEVVSDETRSTVLGAVDDAIYHLDDLVTERSADYTEDDLEDIRERLADLKRLIQR